jgi:hypothetical protein
MRTKRVSGRKAHALRSEIAEILAVLNALEQLASRQRAGTVEANRRAVPRHSGRLLGNLLVLRGYLAAGELESLLEYQAHAGKRLGALAVEKGFISERVLFELLAEQHDMPIIDLARTPIDRDVARAIPYWEARQMRAVPTRRRNGCIEVAIADPTNRDVLDALREILGASLRFGLAPAWMIDSTIKDVWRPRPSFDEPSDVRAANR